MQLQWAIPIYQLRKLYHLRQEDILVATGIVQVVGAQDGNRSAGNNPTYAYNEYRHQLAGFYKIGDVVITNKGEGRVMVRSD